MAPVETKFYNLLEVDVTATDADLRRAYKKQALRLHPDKGGNPDEFKKMKEAYDVLSDPQKRSLYDKYGPEVVDLIDGRNASPTQVMMALSRVGVVERCCFLCVLVSLFLLILSPLILFSLRWDRDVTFPWAIVFAPLWVFQSALLCLVCTCVQVPAPDDDEELDDEMKKLYEERVGQARDIRFAGGAILLYLMVAEILIALKLQGVMHISWFLVLLPWAFIEMTLLYVHVRRAPAYYIATLAPQMQAAAEAEGVWKSQAFWPFLLRATWWGCLRLLTYFLVAARGDKVIHCSWVVCVIPFTVAQVIQVTKACWRPTRRSGQNGDQETGGGEAAQDEADEEGGPAEGCFSCCIASFWLIMFYCAAYKLDGAQVSAFLVFSPIFTCMATIACCFACVAFQLNPELVSEMAAREEESANLNNPAGDAQHYGTVEPKIVVLPSDPGDAAPAAGSDSAAAAASASAAPTTAEADS
mmetsp:Transcript_44561/g.105611  ORF Transcript_44561/g.105611 Transcript_44561/m.105611 type:complete len:471 (+) Transcript_44561:84-1496(+)